LWRIKKAIGRSCVFAFLSLLFLSPLGFCAEASTEETVPKELLIQVLNDWETSNSELQKLLNAQAEDLTIASEELESLRSLQRKQKEQLLTLRNDLETAQIETKSAKESLDAANRELQNTVACVKDLENKKRRAERQRDFWEGIAAVLGIWRIFG
jgi:Skp family chaperone for outer membrane proteins